MLTQSVNMIEYVPAWIDNMQTQQHNNIGQMVEGMAVPQNPCFSQIQHQWP